METIVFSQASLLAFAACKRRFQLRYLEKLAWPNQPFTHKQRIALEHGQAFHQLAERYFLGLPIKPADLGKSQLRQWWQRFEENMLPFAAGKLMPELRLTVAAGEHFLNGRCDLIRVGQDQEEPSVHIYDWKTSQPKTQEELAQAWQTRLYLAIVSESGKTLVTEGTELDPEHIELTYWYAADPEAPRTISYSEEQHQQNWAELETLIQEIESCFAANDWPLTDNWSHCRVCTYATYCDRYESGSPVSLISEDLVEYEFDPIQFLEPESP